jgi:hypothetical protein
VVWGLNEVVLKARGDAVAGGAIRDALVPPLAQRDARAMSAVGMPRTSVHPHCGASWAMPVRAGGFCRASPSNPGNGRPHSSMALGGILSRHVIFLPRESRVETMTRALHAR